MRRPMVVLFLFWVPLALMWLMMGIEQPALNGVIARLPQATLHLAAFEVAFGLALVIESPILQILSAATAMVRGSISYRAMARFMHMWAVLLTGIHVVVSIPGIFYRIADGLLGVPTHVVTPAREVFVLLIPFAAMVGYRRLWQGALIQAGKTGLVAWTMTVRLVVTLTVLIVGYMASTRGATWALPGHRVAGLALIAGVVAGAAAARVLFAVSVYPNLSEVTPTGEADHGQTLRELLAFYIPLSLTSIMSLVSRPILAFGISRSVAPLLSLATWPVIQSVLFLFTSIALSYQEAVVARVSVITDGPTLLRRFGLLLSLALTVLFALLTASGGSALWFERVAGLEPSLIALARPAMVILVLMPLTVTWRSYFSGLLVARRQTSFLGIATGANTVTLLALVIILPQTTAIVGTVVAAIAFGGANLVQTVVLWVGDRVTQRGARVTA